MCAWPELYSDTFVMLAQTSDLTLQATTINISQHFRGQLDVPRLWRTTKKDGQSFVLLLCGTVYLLHSNSKTLDLHYLVFRITLRHFSTFVTDTFSMLEP